MSEYTQLPETCRGLGPATQKMVLGAYLTPPSTSTLDISPLRSRILDGVQNCRALQKADLSAREPTAGELPKIPTAIRYTARERTYLLGGTCIACTSKMRFRRSSSQTTLDR